MKPSRLPLGILAVALGLVAGCGNPTGTLSGKVKLNDEPLEAGVIMAFNNHDEQIALTTIQDGGEYTLTDLPLGPVVLVVQTYTADGQPVSAVVPPSPPKPGGRPLPPEVAKEEESHVPEAVAKAKAKLKLVPLKYTSNKESDLKVTVVKGITPYDIVMTGKGELPKLPGPSSRPGGPPPPPPVPPRRS